jgi:SpoVK/Ycf46/Vps4 family AAA+-type ATPase
MPVTWDTFERYKQKGLDARRAGQWDSARIYLLEAARAMVELSKDAKGDDLREGRRQMASRLLELARDCDEAKAENRRSAPAPSRKANGASSREKSSEADGETSASQWVVKEKPSIRFADVAGLEDVKEDIRLKMIYPFQHPELAERFAIKAAAGSSCSDRRARARRCSPRRRRGRSTRRSSASRRPTC